MRQAEGTGRGRPGLHRLSWFANGDRLDVAVAANRLAAAGFADHQPLDPGEAEDAFRRNRRIELKLTER